MNPLLTTFSPLIPTKIGSLNRELLIQNGFDNIFFRPNQKISKYLSRRFFLERGNPKIHWDAGVNAFPVHVALEKNIKLVYFSTNYVYPGTKGNYKETDSLLPVNSYAWSKLGGEASVQLYKNSLIVRVCMTEKPFVHKVAFSNVITSFMYHEDVVKILFKLINKKGIINIGGSPMTVYNFVKKNNKNISKLKLSKKNNIGMPINSSVNVSKMKKIIK
jgi:dTDP-4-dehydrorhamnose reductase